MKMTTRVAYCNMRHYKSKNILIGIAIILTTLLLFVIPSIGKDMVEVNFAVINKIYPTWHALYSGSVVKTQIQSFYNELIYIVDKGEGYFPTRLHNQSTVLDSRRTLEFGC